MKPHSLIIGGTRGAGRVAVRLLAERGHRVSVIGRADPNPTDLQADVQFYTAELNDTSARTTVIEQLLADSGPLNYLTFYQRFRGEGDDWLGEFSSSLTISKELIETTRESFVGDGDKAITMISSVASRMIATEQPPSYHVAKAGLTQLMRYYAVALGPSGIRVNAISPGSIIKEESRGFYDQHPELMDLYQQIVPLGRICRSEDIAQTLAFLCSSEAGFLTGQELLLDGGLSLQWQESLARRLSPLKDLQVTRTPNGTKGKTG